MSSKAATEKLAIEVTNVLNHLHRPYVALNYVIPASQIANYPPSQTLDHGASSTESTTTVPNSTVNATTTLPYVMDPNVKGLFAKGKQVVKLYKNGIVNVWKNNKQTKQIYSKLNASIPGSSLIKSPGIFSQKKSFSMVTQTIIDKANIDIIQSDRLLEKNQTESESGNEKSNSDQQTLTPSIVVSYLPDLHTSFNRSEYQLLKRTPKDFIKLPIFSVVFGVFFECTPLIVALFPGIVPSTCLLPFQSRQQLSNREKAIDHFKTTREKALQLASKEDGVQSISTRKPLQYRSSTYKLSKEELYQLVRALNLVPKYIPLFIYPTKNLYKRVESCIDYLKADSYMISWSMGDSNSPSSDAAVQSSTESNSTRRETKPENPQTAVGLAGVWGLDPRELVKACHERLIPTTYKEVSSETVDGKQQTTTVTKPKPLNLLRVELFLWIVNFLEGKYDAGFLLNGPRDLIDYQDLETTQKRYQEFIDQQIRISSNF